MLENTEHPKPEEKVCYNCKYMLWLVGLGLGVRCGYEYHTSEEWKAKIPEMVPHLRHTCVKFESKHQNAIEPD